MSAWLTVIGVGAEGLASLTPAARDLVANAEVLVGGLRHLEMVPGGTGERIVIKAPLAEVIAAIANHRGRRVVVLASGDPLHYGIGVNLLDQFRADEIAVMPHHSSFTLATARLNWPRHQVTTLTVHGRPLEILHRHIQAGARLLVLANDGETPARIAALLTVQGFGPSRIIALENLGDDETMLEGTAESWPHPRGRDLVTVAIECRPGPQATAYSTAPGLPDEAFEHDGQITKREVRAVTLAALAPRPRQTAVGCRRRCRLDRHRMAARRARRNRHRHRARRGPRRPHRAQRRRAWRARTHHRARRGAGRAAQPADARRAFHRRRGVQPGRARFLLGRLGAAADGWSPTR